MYPFSFARACLPCSLRTSASIPGSGNVADPGFRATSPNFVDGEIMIPPVSVCHHVSTTGHLPPPILSKYHSQTCGLMGSPTVPSTLSDLRSCLAGGSSPKRMRPLSAVGEVYNMFTL